MDELEKFEKRFANAWFSIGWSDVEVKQQKTTSAHKDLATLQEELQVLDEQMESIAQKQLRLANLAKFYSN